VSTARVRITRRELGESYIVGMGAVLSLVLVGNLVLRGPRALLWSIVGLPAALVFVGTATSVDRLGFDGDDVWTVAVASAFSLGVAALLVGGLDLLTRVLAIPRIGLSQFAMLFVLATVTGTLGGVILVLRRSSRRLGLRNSVLHRVLRHNLRNDMTVLLCLLDEIETGADETQQARIDEARRKIDTLVDLTDKVRKVNVTVSGRSTVRKPANMADLVQSRIDSLTQRYPSVRVETDLSEGVHAWVGEDFGLVLDNVFQCAVTRTAEPHLRIALERSGSDVSLRIDDCDRSIPEGDLAAIASAGESSLEHGYGMELWLVYWIVETHEGAISVDDLDCCRRIEIRIDRASTTLLPGSWG